MNSQQPPDRVAWFVLQAQTDLMERYEMSHRVINLRGWRLYNEDGSLQRIVPLPKNRIMWYQVLMEREHRDA